VGNAPPKCSKRRLTHKDFEGAIDALLRLLFGDQPNGPPKRYPLGSFGQSVVSIRDHQ